MTFRGVQVSDRDRIKRTVAQLVQGARQSGTGWWRANCPECAARTGKIDYKQCLAISSKHGVFKCWKCGLRGRLDGFDAFDTDEAEERPVDEMPPPDGFISAHLGAAENLSMGPAFNYLRTRVPEELWEETEVGACASGIYAGRVIIPVLSPRRAWLGWVGRTWYPSDRTYTYPPGMNRGALLYNSAVLDLVTDVPVLVVEGVFDALHLWPDAVALFGKASEEQVEALKATNRPVVVVLDGDAWTEGYALATRLKLHGRRAGYVRLPPTLDPDEVPRDWLADEVARSLW